MNSLSKNETADGWILLFDGTTRFGWGTVGGAKWKVADGALVSEEGESWILTNTEFTDFTLKVEFRVGDGGNSGICFRSARGPKPYATGYEMQIGDHVRGEPTGSIEHVAPAPPGARKANSWQSAVITAEGSHLTVVLDGKPLVDTRNPKFGHGGAYSTNTWADTRRGRIFVWLVQHAGFPGEGGKAQDAFKKAGLDACAAAKP